MSHFCAHGNVCGRCPDCLPPPRLNVDRFGMPRDYATYIWLLYRRRVTDESPARVTFLVSRPVSQKVSGL